MTLRKSSYFKPLCLLVAALFTAQCVSIERKLIATEEKVIENESREFIYELEKIKAPSAQDPTIEYRIVKFPANRVESINTYKLRKVNRWGIFLGACLLGALIGRSIGYSLKDDFIVLVSHPLISSLVVGGLIGISIIGGKKSSIKEEIKVPKGNYLTKKTDSTPIPAQNLPLELKLGTPGKSNSFKTQTNEQGIVRINLVDDLKMTKFPPDHPLILYIYYQNPESQLKELFIYSLGPQKEADKHGLKSKNEKRKI